MRKGGKAESDWDSGCDFWGWHSSKGVLSLSRKHVCDHFNHREIEINLEGT